MIIGRFSMNVGSTRISLRRSACAVASESSHPGMLTRSAMPNLRAAPPRLLDITIARNRRRPVVAVRQAPERFHQLRGAFASPKLAEKRQSDAPIARGLAFQHRAVRRVGENLDLAAGLRQPTGNDIDPIATEDHNPVAVDEHAIECPPQPRAGAEPKKFEATAMKVNHIRHTAIAREPRDNDFSVGATLQRKADVHYIDLLLPRRAP
jgi:hypothetical protein